MITHFLDCSQDGCEKGSDNFSKCLWLTITHCSLPKRGWFMAYLLLFVRSPPVDLCLLLSSSSSTECSFSGRPARSPDHRTWSCHDRYCSWTCNGQPPYWILMQRRFRIYTLQNRSNCERWHKIQYGRDGSPISQTLMPQFAFYEGMEVPMINRVSKTSHILRLRHSVSPWKC